MKLLIDAQLPRKMAAWFVAAGCDAIHTLDLPGGNRTSDERINDTAEREHRVVVTKDADFVDSHLLKGRPEKLLLISTGNIGNRDLEALLVSTDSGHGSRVHTTRVPGVEPSGDRHPRVIHMALLR